MQWQILMAVGIGGFLGALGRFVLSGWAQKIWGGTFPFGTLLVNVLGSFIIGFMVLYFEQSIAPQQKALIMTGFLGALTTFSTFSLETVLMLQEQLYLKALSNISLNILLCVTATLLGMALFRKLYGI